jgi:DNA-binding NarL/FixJ family response regulator
VLIGEDAPELRELLRMRLEQDPSLQVLDALSDTASIVASAAAQAPDALLVDLAMPGDLGPAELLRALRGALPDAAIVVFSGTDPDGLNDAPAREAVDAYFPKATELSVVRQGLCEAALRRRRGRQRL